MRPYISIMWSLFSWFAETLNVHGYMFRLGLTHVDFLLQFGFTPNSVRFFAKIRHGLPFYINNLASGVIVESTLEELTPTTVVMD